MLTPKNVDGSRVNYYNRMDPHTLTHVASTYFNAPKHYTIKIQQPEVISPMNCSSELIDWDIGQVPAKLDILGPQHLSGS